MLVIPNIIDPAVPHRQGRQRKCGGAALWRARSCPDFEVPYHVDIMERLAGIDLDSARKTSGNGFYYLCGDIARLHSAVLSYARDFMIDQRLHLLYPALYDPQQRGQRRHELCRNGKHDV